MYMMQYDEVISLGYNCEISFRIRDYFGKLVSWPFSWTYILDRDAFLVALLSLDDIFQGDVHICKDPRVNSMIECDKFHICFHPRSQYTDSDGEVSVELFPEAVEELRSRVKYLVDKFKNVLNNPEKKLLFIIGITDNGETSDKEFIIKLNSVLAKICNRAEYTLVVVLPNKRYTAELKKLECEKIKIRKIKKFGIQKCNDISTDMIGWGHILGEFLGKERIPVFYFRVQKHRAERILGAISKRIRNILLNKS